MKKFNKNFNVFFIIFYVVIFIQACNDTSVNNSIPKLTLWEIYNQNPTLTKYGFLYSTLSIYMYDSVNIQSDQVQYIYFYDSLGNYRPADNVTLNNNEVLQRNDNKNVIFDGNEYHRWVVTGNQYIPSYSDSIKSINMFYFISPLPKRDTITKNNGIILNYQPINDIDSIIVFVKLNKGLSSLLDTNFYKSSNSYLNADIFPNTGSIYLSPSFFQTFPSNCYVTVEMIALRSKEKLINGRGYITACIISCRADYIFL